jgi:hypothetical protein
MAEDGDCKWKGFTTEDAKKILNLHHGGHGGNLRLHHRGHGGHRGNGKKGTIRSLYR